jgi:hypothetical protein
VSLLSRIESAIAGAPSASGSAAQGTGPDVEAVLDSLAASSRQTLHWRTSITDFMTLVGIDPTYENRKELASELGYQGDPSDSVAMSIWLHKHLMKRLSKNGATVPASLRH